MELTPVGKSHFTKTEIADDRFDGSLTMMIWQSSCRWVIKPMLAYLPDESAAGRFAATARAAMQPEWLDIVQAYSSVAIHFDPDRSTFANVVERLQELD